MESAKGLGFEHGTKSDVASFERQGHRRFHLALAGIFGFCFCPFVSWWVALAQPKTDPSPWRRRLLGLAIVDTVVFLCLVIASVQSFGSDARSVASVQRPRIGISLNPSQPLDGVEVVGVMAGSPAERAGLRIGDKIRSLDESSVRTNERFSQDIGQTLPGGSRSLHVQRGNSEFDVSVVPIVGQKNAPQPTQPLFARAPRSEPSWSVTTEFQETANNVPALLVLVIVAAVAWRRKIRLRPLVNVMAAIGVPVIVMFVVTFTFRRTVGLSLGAVLVGMLMGGLTMLVLAFFSMRRLDQGEVTEVAPGAPLGTMPAFGLGLFYAFAGAARAAIFISFVAPILHLPDHPATEVFGVSPGWGASGVALFALAGVVVAPIAEECLFRGVLLPWLTTWMKPVGAVLVSTLAFGAGHLYYGSSVLIPIVYGVVLGWMRLRTGRLRAGIVLHMLINAVSTGVLLLKTSGM